MLGPSVAIPEQKQQMPKEDSWGQGWSGAVQDIRQISVEDASGGGGGGALR